MVSNTQYEIDVSGSQPFYTPLENYTVCGKIWRGKMLANEHNLTFWVALGGIPVSHGLQRY